MNELQSNTLKTNNSSLSCSSGPTDQGSVFTRLDRFMREVFFGGGILPSPPRMSFLKEWWNAWTCNQASNPVIATVPRRKNKNKKGICLLPASWQNSIPVIQFYFIADGRKQRQAILKCICGCSNQPSGGLTEVWMLDYSILKECWHMFWKDFFFFCCLQRWKGKPGNKDKSSTAFPNAVIIICQREINISRVNVRY